MPTEEELGSTPFETYDLMRGQSIGLAFGLASTLKVVGKLKCIVRVTEGDPSDEPLFVDKDNFETLEKAKERNDAIMGELLRVTRAGSRECFHIFLIFLSWHRGG